jgi:septin family protein
MLLMQFILFIKVARDDDITEQIGKNIYFDLVDHEKVRSFRIQKQTPFQQFKVHACIFLFITRNCALSQQEMEFLKKLHFW